MALIPGYEYDIFISYAHADNASETSEGDGWIDQFYQYLETKLSKHSENIKIWWDSKQLDGSQVFDKTIKHAIDNSAIMVCLNSRRYAESDYCQKELQHFRKKAAGEETGLLVGDRSRIINVLLFNIHYDDWLSEFEGTSGFKFHDEGDYGDPLSVEAKEPFSEQMKLLRNALVKMMEEFESEVIEPPPPPPPSEFTIYFGEINDSLVDRRDGIISELEGKGYLILKGDPSNATAKEHEKQTREAIDSAQLAVHLLGEFPGRKIADDPETRYIQKQVEIGMESPTPQLIWLSNDLYAPGIENEEHRVFLTSLEDGSLSVRDQELIRSNEAELTQLIIDHAERLKKEKVVRTNGVLKVLLDTHTDDFKYAFDLKKNLQSNDIRLIFNPEDGDPQENIEILYENINEAQKYIFLYGKEENNDWVDVRVKNTMKKLVEFDRYDQNIFVYLTPPHKETKDIRVAQSPMVKIVNNSNMSSIDSALFKQFLIDLKAEAK